jgi:GT2 family glycosyltransferase
MNKASKIMPRVSVVVPSWNSLKWLPGCFEGLLSQTFQNFEVILVDNGSMDDTLEFVRRHYPQVRVYAFETNRGFTAAVNAGIQLSRGKYVVLLNTDTYPQPDWLAALVEVMDNSPPEVGCLASKMLNMENPGIIDDAGDLLSWYGSAKKRGHGCPAGKFTEADEVFSPCGGAVLYRRSFLDEVGGYDERFVAYLEDVDVGLRGRLLGYRCLFVPAAEILHHGHGAGIPQGQYVRFMTRNRLMLLTKNLPLRLLLRHARRLLFGQIYFVIAYQKPLHSVAGYLSYLAALPYVWRERRKTVKKVRVSAGELEEMLSDDLFEPRLRDVLLQRFRRSRS